MELFHALGGLLVPQPHATQELLHPSEKAKKKETNNDPDSDVSVFTENKLVSRRSTPLTFQVISASQ